MHGNIDDVCNALNVCTECNAFNVWTDITVVACEMYMMYAMYVIYATYVMFVMHVMYDAATAQAPDADTDADAWGLHLTSSILGRRALAQVLV